MTPCYIDIQPANILVHVNIKAHQSMAGRGSHVKFILSHGSMPAKKGANVSFLLQDCDAYD